jgi:hypothetical protein
MQDRLEKFAGVSNGSRYIWAFKQEIKPRVAIKG